MSDDELIEISIADDFPLHQTPCRGEGRRRRRHYANGASRAVRACNDATVATHRITKANEGRYRRRSASNSTSVRLAPNRRLKNATSSSRAAVRA